jgi:diguanylate cyclase (GGDEF)-like protein/PAS domain S-box-containing protein
VKSDTTKFSNVFIVRLVAGVLLINLFIIALAGISIYHSKILYEKRAAQTTQNLSRISADYIDGVIDKIDLALVIVADEMGRQTLSGKFNRHLVNSFIVQKHTDPLGLDTLRVSDAQGEILFVAGADAGKPENIADNDFFKKLRDNPNEELVISEPVLGVSTGNWNLKLARRINRQDGSFAGVVYCIMGVEHFHKAFASIDLGKDGSIALRNKDLAVIARYAKSEGVDSSNIGQKIVSSKLKELVDSGHDNATYKAKYPIDGIERTISYRKISNHPLYVTIGIATNTYLAEWRRETAKVSIAIFLFFMISLFVSRFVLSGWKRQQQIFKAYRESEECFRAIFENALVGSILLTPEGQIVKVNLMLENLLGYMAKELESLNIKDIIFPDDYESDRDLYQSMLDGLRNFYQIEKRIVTNYDTVIWGMLSISVVRDDLGNPRFVVYMIDDISARKGAEEQLNFQSTHDGMTGLYNRAYFDAEFDRMQLGLHFPVSIIVIDLDGLKQVNDSQGHEAGDRLIIVAAMVMKEAFQKNDLVARIGGDEFAILLPESNEETVGSAVERLRKCQADFNERGGKPSLNFSIGTATAYSNDQLSNIWKQADDRMYAEKALHKSETFSLNTHPVSGETVH